MTRLRLDSGRDLMAARHPTPAPAGRAARGASPLGAVVVVGSGGHFFDFACGAAVFSTLSEADYCSTVELKVNYFYPLHLHDKLVAKTQVVFRGKKLCVVLGHLYRNGDESKAVAMVTSTFNIVTPKA